MNPKLVNRGLICTVNFDFQDLTSVINELTRALKQQKYEEAQKIIHQEIIQLRKGEAVNKRREIHELNHGIWELNLKIDNFNILLTEFEQKYPNQTIEAIKELIREMKRERAAMETQKRTISRQGVR